MMIYFQMASVCLSFFSLGVSFATLLLRRKR